MDDTTTATAAEVRAALAKHRVDDATLAGWLGVSASTANRKKNGRQPFTLTDLLKVGTHLDQDYRQWLPAGSSMPSTTAYAVREDVA